MNEIVNGLKPKCDICQILDPQINMMISYDCKEIINRKIEVTCSHMKICEMYKEFKEMG